MKSEKEEKKIPGLSVLACSCMTLQSESGKNYWFRTCDIDTDIWQDGAHIVSFPANREIAFQGRKPEKSKYTVLGMTDNSLDTWLLDGVNSEGLTGGLLLLNEGTSVDQADEDHEGYVGMELVTKFLSACKTVDEVIKLAEKIQICSIPYGGQYVPATMHYFFTDPSGNEVVLEAADRAKPGIFTVYEKEDIIGVMTNSPTYAKQMSNLSWYISASPELKYGLEGKTIDSLCFGKREVKGDQAAEHLLRSDTFPASYCSYDRFVRLAVLKALNESGRKFTDDKMLALGSGIMSAVFEPRSKGVFHYIGFDEKEQPIRQKDSCSQYLVMYDVTEKILYMKAFDMAAWTKYELCKCKDSGMTRFEVKHDSMAGILDGNL